MGKKSKRTARKNSAAKVSTSSAAAAAKATEVSGPGTTEAQVTLVRDRTAAAAKVTKVRGLDITTDQVVPIAQALQLDAQISAGHAAATSLARSAALSALPEPAPASNLLHHRACRPCIGRRCPGPWAGWFALL